METENILQAIEFLEIAHPQESPSANFSKLVRKKFPHWPLPLIGLVCEQSELRKKALKKFTHSQKMLFTKKSLEQSTSEELAIYTASLFKNSEEILDVCSGIGGNSIGLQNKFSQVSTIEPDALLNAIHEYNLKLYYPHIKINRLICELKNEHFREHPFIFIDPDRRATGKKSYSIDDHAPDINLILENSKFSKEIIIKLSPMINADQTASGFSPLYLADEMELKQNLWLGGNLSENPITFAILFNGKIYDSLHLPDQQNLADNGEYLYEINPAIIKASESFTFAQKYQLTQISESTKTFTGQLQNLYPFANCWKILLQEPFQSKKLTAMLQSLPFDRFEIKPYGIEEDEIKKLISKWGKGKGKAGTVFIFKQKDFKQVIVAEKVSGF